MAGFQTHIATSTVLGFAYAGGAYSIYEFPWDTCVLAGGLCAVSGMLPDLDSGPGRPLRESLAFAAAVVPMLLYDRARRMGLTHEQMALAGGAIYCAIRFGLGWILRHYTVHRGMYHSFPAAAIATGLAFLICATGTLEMRLFKAGGVLLGFMSHLILDEIWSVKLGGGGIQFKSSFGTAMKFWGDNAWSNLSCYAKLVVVSLLVLYDPVWSTVGSTGKELNRVATSIVDEARDATSRAVRSRTESEDEADRGASGERAPGGRSTEERARGDAGTRKGANRNSALAEREQPRTKSVRKKTSVVSKRGDPRKPPVRWQPQIR